MKKGNLHGKRQGDRDIFMRIRVSEEERSFLHRWTNTKGITVSKAIREALAKDGLLPENSIVD